jgi:nucleotide-binding universal stress UspA family protein
MEANVKNILLLIHDDSGQEARLRAALDITRACEGHLTCVDVSIMPVLVDDAFSGGMGVAMVLADERETETKNADAIQHRLAGEGVAWTWIDATGTPAPRVENMAILQELIVINRRLEDFPWPNMLNMASDLMLKSHKPILAVPETAGRMNIGGRALVAWDGSPHADAALQAALPFLRRAARVILLEVADHSVEVPAEEAASFLSRHGIASVVIRKSVPEAVADVILSEIDHLNADYVVMGGYGHSRRIEAVFGGVTRKMLSEAPVPVFFAH